MISGANGHLAGLTIKELLRKLSADEFAVGTHQPKTRYMDELSAQGVDVRLLDYNKAETLRPAFDGVDKILLIPTWSDHNIKRISQIWGAVYSALSAGVSHFVYAGALNAYADSIANKTRVAHYGSEWAIKETGKKWTCIRNALYAEAIMRDMQETLDTGILRMPDRYGIPWAFIARSDLGESTAAVLTGENTEGMTYRFTMERAYTSNEIAEIISSVWKKKIICEHLSPKQYVQEQMIDRYGYPQESLEESVSMYESMVEGECNFITNDYERLTGRKPLSMEEFMQKLKDSGEILTGNISSGIIENAYV